MYMGKPLQSLVIDGVEISDPSLWLKEAADIAKYSKCKVKWLTFGMARSQEPEAKDGLYCHSDSGYRTRVVHYVKDGKRVDVPMVTRAEQELIHEIDHLCAMNLSRLDSIEFFASEEDAQERLDRSFPWKIAA